MFLYSQFSCRSLSSFTEISISCCIWSFVLESQFYYFCSLHSKIIHYSAPVGSAVLPSVCLSVCVCVCLPTSISLEPLGWSSQTFLRRSPVAVARSSSGGVAIRYVLPVLWMTSCLAIWQLAALRYQGRVWRLWMPCFNNYKAVYKHLDTVVIRNAAVYLRW